MAGLPFTHDEVVLCAYAARFNGDDFGGIDAIHSLSLRSRESIQLKILNIAAMLDEEGIARDSEVSPLTGLPSGQRGRRTNWDIVSGLLDLGRNQHLAECRRILQRAVPLPEEAPGDEPFFEGAVCRVLVNSYERDPRARRMCIAHYGPTCVVCGFNFGIVYGPLAEGFIHVHHLKPLAEICAQYEVDPIADLRPVCANCHAILHLGGGCRGIEEARRLVDPRVLAFWASFAGSGAADEDG
jgi:predicted HNH restriction endonuclease